MRILFLFFSLITTIILQAQESKDITYIRKHAILAVEEMHLYKVPASITLAQGLLETGGGQSRLAERANNHFGIKCKSEIEWPLHKGRIYHDDDAKGECFRSYNSVSESYRDHSEFLALRPYYKALFTIPTTDYKAWAHGLKKAGYATDPTYANKLISRIEKYNLDQFDHVTSNEVYAKLFTLYGNNDDKNLANNTSKVIEKTKDRTVITASAVKEKDNEKYLETTTTTLAKTSNETRPSITIETRKTNTFERIKKHPNNIEYIIVEAGETLGTIGRLYKKTPSELAKYNEIKLGTKLKEGQIVFFDMKKPKGSQVNYKAKNGDDMYTISQKFGVRLSSLYKFNNMSPGDQPTDGQEIFLKSKKKS